MWKQHFFGWATYVFIEQDILGLYWLSAFSTSILRLSKTKNKSGSLFMCYSLCSRYGYCHYKICPQRNIWDLIWSRPHTKIKWVVFMCCSQHYARTPCAVSSFRKLGRNENLAPDEGVRTGSTLTPQKKVGCWTQEYDTYLESIGFLRCSREPVRTEHKPAAKSIGLGHRK
jgi:hypothetical protein